MWCSRLLRAAGGSWQRERARPGRDHCDTPMELFFFVFYNCCQAHLYILLSSYRCCPVFCLFFYLFFLFFTAASPAQPGGTFTTVLYGQIICNIKALMMTWNYSCPQFSTLMGTEDGVEWLRIGHVWLNKAVIVLLFFFGTNNTSFVLFFCFFPSVRSHLRDEMLR